MDGAKKLLLVVDDERSLAHALETKLTKEGLEARSAFSGEDALKLLRTEKFDLLLLDLVMVKVDGFHVLEAMKKEGIHVPTIVLSNLGDEEVQSKVRDLGAREFLVKAETPMSQVVEHIEKVLA
jgi:DNA-binding response OmpR family regulator